jgi:hypothetical protein
MGFFFERKMDGVHQVKKKWVALVFREREIEEFEI